MAAADIPLNVNQTDIHAIMATSLPKHVIIQTSQEGNRYLRLCQKNPDSSNALRFCGDYRFDLCRRFEVEQAKTATGLIHIRSLKNSKYWANYGTDNNWIAAMADKPEENQSDKHCTLFQPIFMYSNNNRFVRLRHVQTGLFATFFHGSNNYLGFLALMPGCILQTRLFPEFFHGSNNFLGLLALMHGCIHYLVADVFADVFTFIDWESVVVLPDRIRITKSTNGNQFKANADGSMDVNSKADKSTLFDFDVYPSRDGGIRLKSTHYGTYWTAKDNSKRVQLRKADTEVHNINTVFLPTIHGDNRLILRSLKTNRCWDNLEIEEPVLSRRINNVRYHLTDVRLYNEKTIALTTDDSSNRTNHSLTSKLNLKTTISNSTNWSTSGSLKLGVKETATFGIPNITSGRIEISAEATGSMNWGKTKTESQEVGSEKTIAVPAMTRMKATLMGTRVSYHLPFSYTQYDFLRDGSTNVYEKDGIFTANSSYGYRYEVVELPLRVKARLVGGGVIDLFACLFGFGSSFMVGSVFPLFVCGVFVLLFRITRS